MFGRGRGSGVQGVISALWLSHVSGVSSVFGLSAKVENN